MVIHIIAKFAYRVDNPVDWSRRVQNFVICLEMLFFAVAHVFVFPTEEWAEGYSPRERVRGKLGDNIALGDFVRDVKHMVKTRKRHKIRRKKGGTGPYADLELDVASAADGTATTAPSAATETQFTITDNDEVFASEESYHDDDTIGDDDDDDGEYIVIFRSKGRTRVMQDGESIELPSGSADLGRIQRFIESSTAASARRDSNGHETRPAPPTIQEERAASNSPVLQKCDDGELI